MAVDEALLESAAESGVTTVRIYEWKAATISVGYFQDLPADGLSPELAELPIVRRLSGGGAILHHHEITYSCAIPAGHPLAGLLVEMYEQVHRCIVELLRGHGIESALRGQENQQAGEEFLCFARGDPRDILIQQHKILGSAQRRRRGAVLMHGSLLLKRSPYASQFPGVLDLIDKPDSLQQLSAELAEALSACLAEQRTFGSLTRNELERAQELCRQRYHKTGWRPVRNETRRGRTVNGSVHVCTHASRNT